MAARTAQACSSERLPGSSFGIFSLMKAWSSTAVLALERANGPTSSRPADPYLWPLRQDSPQIFCPAAIWSAPLGPVLGAGSVTPAGSVAAAGSVADGVVEGSPPPEQPTARRTSRSVVRAWRVMLD